MTFTHKNPKKQARTDAFRLRGWKRPRRVWNALAAGRFVVIATLGALSAACVKDDAGGAPPDLGYSYFPLQPGAFFAYRVDSIFHDHPDPAIAGVHDTTRYFVREVFDTLITDGAGDAAMRVLRYKRDHDTLPWAVADVWVAKITPRNAQRVEENQRFIKLGFPISGSTRWDANALNTGDEWKCSYDSLHAGRSLGELYFERTVRVSQRDFKNLVEDEYAYEIYADGVGLIKRYHRELTTQVNYVNDPVAANIRLGFEYRMELIDYGTE